MPNFEQHKFNELSEERQARLILQLLLDMDQHWEDQNLKLNKLDNIKNYISWAEQLSPSLDFKKSLSLKRLLSDESTRRQVLDLAVSFEHFLNISTTDSDIFKITTQDTDLNHLEKKPLFIVLDHLRSAFNVGSIFRTAECLGVSHIYLIGYTPTPEDQKVQKTALGTDQFVTWSQHDHLDEVLNELKLKKISCVALETGEATTNIFEYTAPDQIALVLGNERFGLHTDTLKKMDTVLSIPTFGNKNSLNVANSFSISGFEIIRQWNQNV